MAEPPRYPDANDPVGEGLDRTSRPGMPGWVKVFLIVFIILAVLAVIALASGRGGPHGPRRHTGSSFFTDSRPASSVTEAPVASRGFGASVSG